WSAKTWTGTELLLWDLEGAPGSSRAQTGWAYNPTSDTWRALSTTGMPSPRSRAAVVWDGRDILVWGGQTEPGPVLSVPCCLDLMDGGRYDPVADTWKPISNMGAPATHPDEVPVWTGTEMLLWGGVGSTFEQE